MHNKSICHRDLKPENIFIDAETWTLKIGDLGAATEFISDQTMSELFGTPFYIAPEVLKQNYNSKCDNWSLGVVLFVLLTGKPPFYGKAEHEIYRKIAKGIFNEFLILDLSGQCQLLIKNLIKKDIEERMEIQSAVQSEWFSTTLDKQLNEFEENCKECLGNVIRRMKHFSRLGILLRVMLALYGDLYFRKAQTKDVYKLFNFFDRDCKGYIDKEDIKTIAEMEGERIDDGEARKLVCALQFVTHGKVEYKAFLASQIVSKEYYSRSKAKGLFAVLNDSKLDYISSNSLKAIFQENQMEFDFDKTFKEQFRATKLYENLFLESFERIFIN